MGQKSRPLRHLSLFSGIGGFDLAAHWCGWKNVAHVEIDEFCNQVVAKHFPQSICYTDIKQFDGTPYRGQIDVISGGSPCQPYSISGIRKGNDDDRALWPEMLRIIDEIKPAYIVGENVVGASDMALHQWEADLEALGYEVTTFDISASACGLPTMERHLWLVASSNGVRLQGDIERSIQRLIERASEFQGENQRMRERRDIRESRFCRVGERVSRRLDKIGKQRLKALGNAIVPQVAYEIFQAIEHIRDEPCKYQKEF